MTVQEILSNEERGDKMSTPLDALGNEFYVGAIITYPGRAGAFLWQRYAVIREIVEYGTLSERDRYTLKVFVVSSNYNKTINRLVQTTIRRLNRVTIVHPILLNPDVVWQHQLSNKRIELMKKIPTDNVHTKQTMSTYVDAVVAGVMKKV